MNYKDLKVVELTEYLKSVTRLFIQELFGHNVLLITEFHYFLIEKDFDQTKPEYYISNLYNHFDFWFDRNHDIISQLAYGVSDLYLQITGSDKTIFMCHSQLLAFYTALEPLLEES